MAGIYGSVKDKDVLVVVVTVGGGGKASRPPQALYQAKLHSVISYGKRLITDSKSPHFSLVT